MTHVSSLLICGVVGVGLAGCDTDVPTPERPTAFSGPGGASDFARPLFHPPDRLIIQGCCSLYTSDAQVSVLEGDVFGRMIEGPDFAAVVSFGTGLAPLPTFFVETGSIVIDGVSVTRLVGPNGSLARKAVVPLSADAQTRNVTAPVLQIEANCTSSRGCAALEALLDSLRF